MPAGIIELEHRITAPPDVVFRYFTDASLHTAWQPGDPELDARPGGIYKVPAGPGMTMLGEYVEVTPPTRIVLTWGWEDTTGRLPADIAVVTPGSTKVEIDLVPDGDNTIVRLTHTGFPDGASLPPHHAGWRIYLEGLATHVAGGDTSHLTDPGSNLYRPWGP